MQMYGKFGEFPNKQGALFGLVTQENDDRLPFNSTESCEKLHASPDHLGFPTDHLGLFQFSGHRCETFIGGGYW